MKKWHILLAPEIFCAVGTDSHLFSLGRSLVATTAFSCAVRAANISDTKSANIDIQLTNSTIDVTYLGSLSLSDVGFAEVISQDGEDVLFVSSFALLGDSVHRINDISTLPTVGLEQLEATKISGSITWPNDISFAPEEVFGTEGVVVGGGFLVPTKTDGGIYYSADSRSRSKSWTKLAGPSDWWYHRVEFADMDNDGVTDMVSCRAKQSLGKYSTMLVILKPQDADDPTGEWVETEIGPGCDALFTVADLDGDGIPEVIAPSYFTEKLSIFHSTTGFADPDEVQTIVIDDSIGAAFDAQLVDINGDGTQDLLVTNHQGDGTGSVYAYEIPSDITDVAGWTRHTLASGFPVTQSGLNQASPGSARAFFPTPQAGNAGSAPHIAVAGDAAQKAYVLVPGSAEWEYETTELHDCGCTVGQLAVADVDGDGYSEIIIPCYDAGLLVAYTFGS